MTDHDFRRTGIAISVNSGGIHFLVTDRTLPVTTGRSYKRADTTFHHAATGTRSTVFVVFDDHIEDSGWLLVQTDHCPLCGNTGRITVREGVLSRNKRDEVELPVLEWLNAYAEGRPFTFPADHPIDVVLPCPLCDPTAYWALMNAEAERVW